MYSSALSGLSWGPSHPSGSQWGGRATPTSQFSGFGASPPNPFMSVLGKSKPCQTSLSPTGPAQFLLV